MKTILLVSALLLTVSCGRKRITTVVQNPYDDSKLKTELVLQDARIKALEDRLDALESGFDQLTVNFGDRLNNIESDVSDVEANLSLVNSGISQLSSKTVSLVKVCNSSEYLIKSEGSLYAVYMVSNNLGTYMGKLEENVNYQTTDSVKSLFRVVNNQVQCL